MSIKPLGVTLDAGPSLSVVRPNTAQDAIYNACEEAIGVGMTVEQFRREAAECWALILDDNRKSDIAAWRKP